MPYSLQDQLSKDINFFLVDNTFRLFHFASAGSLLPSIIKKHYDLNRELHSFLLNSDELFEVDINPELSNFVNFENLAMQELYLRDFRFFASRGLYSFDNTIISNSEDQRYHLVAKPIFTKNSHIMLYEKIKYFKKIEHLMLNQSLSTNNIDTSQIKS